MSGPDKEDDGVVLMELQYSGRASLSTMEVEEVLGREKEATKGRGAIGSRQSTGQSSRTGSRQERPGSRTEGLC